MLLLDLAGVLLAVALDRAAVPAVAAIVPLGVDVGVLLGAEFLAVNLLVHDAVLARLLEGRVELLAAADDVDAPGVVVDGRLAGAAAALGVGAGEGGGADVARLDGGGGGGEEEGRQGEDGEPKLLADEGRWRGEEGSLHLGGRLECRRLINW